jgi:hypothetical protein
MRTIKRKVGRKGTKKNKSTKRIKNNKHKGTKRLGTNKRMHRGGSISSLRSKFGQKGHYTKKNVKKNIPEAIVRTASSLQREEEDVKLARIAANEEIQANEDIKKKAKLDSLKKKREIAEKKKKLDEEEVLKLFAFLEEATPAEIEEVHEIIPQEVTFGNPQNVTFGNPIEESVRSSSPKSVGYMSLKGSSYLRRNAQAEQVKGRQGSLARRQIEQIIARVEKKPGLFKRIMNVFKFKPKHEKYALTPREENEMNKKIRNANAQTLSRAKSVNNPLYEDEGESGPQLYAMVK